jgi:hypothetical protein
MKKESVVIVVLVILIIAIFIFAIIEYKQNTALKDKNTGLEADRTQLNSDKEQLTNENRQVTTDLKNLQVKYDLLTQDVAQIYKGCYKDNACKGRYPGVRWNCNNVGDETDTNPSHICVCDSSCNLNATEIKK